MADNTPLEEARRLVGKFRSHAKDDIGRESNFYNGKSSAMDCVDEIIPCTWKLKTYQKNGYISVDQRTTTEYWLKVKEEIKNL